MEFLSDAWIWIKAIGGIVFAFGILIFFHELGHFVFARLTGIGVETFSIGFGRGIIKFRRNDIDYQVGWIPFGGYCKMKGQNDFGKIESEGEPDEFYNRPAWARLLTVFAGPLFSYFLGVLIFVVVFFSYGEEFNKIRNVAVPYTLADKTELKTGDEIISIEGRNVKTAQDIEMVLQGYMDKTFVDMTVERNGQKIKVKHRLNNVVEGDIKKIGTFWGFVPQYEVVVGKVKESSPAEKSGLENGDVILAINGKKVSVLRDLTYFINDLFKDAKSLDITVKKESGMVKTYKVNVKVDTVGEGDEQITKRMIGVYLDSPDKHLINKDKINKNYSIPEAVSRGFEMSTHWLVLTVVQIKYLFSGKVKDPTKVVGGPVLMANILGKVINI